MKSKQKKVIGEDFLRISRPHTSLVTHVVTMMLFRRDRSRLVRARLILLIVQHA
jgi:hypothetical protein